MKFLALSLLALPMASAYPGMLGDLSKENLLKMRAEQQKRDAEVKERASILDPLLGTITGLLGSVASGLLDPANKRPEPGYTFKAPGAGDSRGPCPALNLLANYGYLPRNGHVNFGQIVEATARGFNMATDLSTVLAVFAILTDGDIATESWNIGSGSNGIGGLNRHSTVEADVSPNREDYYLGCGDNHHLSSRLFTQNVNFVAAGASKQFDDAAMGNQYAANAQFSQQHNPYLYYFPFPSIVSVVAFNFYPNFFSNGTYGAGGVANYESISSIIGAQYDSKTKQFEYVPERWPTNWYRRATPYEAVQALIEGFTVIYPKYPLGMPIGQFGGPFLNTSTILCDIYQGINSVAPLAIAGTAEEIEAGITWALAKISAVFPAGTVLGCPTNSISKNYLYPNSKQEGGPLNPPPSVQANTGDNVYNKVYFTTAPTTPQCSHVSNP